MDISHSSTFEKHESKVRSYCRSNPAVFERAEGAVLYDRDGEQHLDFLAGAGSLNYGHNNPALRERLIDYIADNGITHSLDFHTAAKEAFLETFQNLILKPRQMDYVVQFTGPTGANAVEAALKLARKITGRSSAVAFTNGFHGVTLGALAATGNQHHRGGAGVPLHNVQRMPFAGYLGEHSDTLAYFEKSLGDKSSGIDLPACVIVETIQGEGGLNVASKEWMQRLQDICRRHSIVLIIDDIQAGCGRSGKFFSFEEMGIKPDIITLSKSLSGYGLPLAVTLIQSGLDCWQPGEHNGTFRGFNHAFVTSRAMLEAYWSDSAFEEDVKRKADTISGFLDGLCDETTEIDILAKGRGLMQGLSFANPDDAAAVCKLARKHRLVIETSGPEDEVLKIFPPLTIDPDELEQGLSVIRSSVEELVNKNQRIAIAAE